MINLKQVTILILVSINDAQLLRNLENCIKYGQPLLIENLDEEIDAVLDPILLKQTYRKGA